ncbi:MAG: cation:proton antiporter [Verrucomicrobiales bacterium]|nr:cation:proton antiporter [Verrucomicrobiales bacterium]
MPKLQFLEPHGGLMLLLGVAIFLAATLPRFLQALPVSVPIILLGFGFAMFKLPLGLEFPSLIEDPEMCKHLTEIAVIISLMGAGLKIDRRMGWKRWAGTWRLIAVTMVFTIVAAAFGGWWLAGLVPASALLLGAVLAPTDPVLASEIQVGPPGKNDNAAEAIENNNDGHEERVGGDPSDEKDEFRFSLTSEAGLNDALAFPFVYAAIAMAAAEGGISHWIGDWFLLDVLYRILVGVACGVGMGLLLGKLILSIPGETKIARALLGPTALAATLVLYGGTEMVEGYGFLAVFIGALVMRGSCKDHPYHESLFHFSEMVERLLSALFLIALGGALAQGVLSTAGWNLILLALGIILVIRPLGGVIGFVGFTQAPWRERLMISFFGVRGVGSFFYLSYALLKQPFPGSAKLWAIVSLTVALSVLIHGILATPALGLLKRKRSTG